MQLKREDIARFQAHSMSVTIQRLEQQYACRILVAPDIRLLVVWTPRTPPDTTQPKVRRSTSCLWAASECQSLAANSFLLLFWACISFVEVHASSSRSILSVKCTTDRIVVRGGRVQEQRHVAQQVFQKLMRLASISDGDSAAPSSAPWKSERPGGSPKPPSERGTAPNGGSNSSNTSNATQSMDTTSDNSTERREGEVRGHAVHAGEPGHAQHAPLGATSLGGAGH